MLSEEKRRQRFEARIERITESGCWIWMGPLTHDGYVRTSINNTTVSMHRMLWERAHGPIPADMQVDHLCNIPCCVNIAHMRLATGRENVLRGNSITAINVRKTHCKRGHPFDSENTYWRPDGGRACKECGRKKALAFYHAKKNK